MRKLIAGTALVAAAGLVGGMTPATATAVSGSAQVQAVQNGPSSVHWTSCASTTLQKRNAQCAMVEVPLDYSHPSGQRIQLAISRVKHTVSASKYQGVMLVNPGGPGGSGLTLSILGEFVPNGAGSYYDWIGFDPRGVGSSKPAVSCDPKYFGFNRPNYVPTSRSIQQAWLAKVKDYAEDCGERNGPILQHLTTVDSAKDMDSIRKALGAKQINYYGFSYGTYLGQVYGTLFPERVRRMVLDSNVDPERIWYLANLDQDVAFNRNINIWFGWIAKYDAVYHLGNTEAAVRKLWYSTLRKLGQHPADGKIGASEWTDIFLFAGYYQATWTDLADTFAGYIHKNDVANLEQHYLDTNTYGDDNGYAVYLGVQCTDVQWPRSWSKWQRDNWKTYAKAPYETWGNAWYNAPCLYWPAKAHKPIKIDGEDVQSVLLIDETLDAATPYSGSLEVRERFPHSSLIALPGGTSHANSLFGDACLDNQIAAYLAHGTRPHRISGDRADTTCAPLPQPVPAGATATVASGQGQSVALAGGARSSRTVLMSFFVRP
jgi:pimeloyl-ACP methyl ester carboxylesterase